MGQSNRLVLIGIAGVVALGAFIFLINRGAGVAPQREAVTIALPDAFKQ